MADPSKFRRKNNKRNHSGVNIPGASSGALTYEKVEIERSKLRGIEPGRQVLMNYVGGKKYNYLIEVRQ
jgi:hypothetical protein